VGGEELLLSEVVRRVARVVGRRVLIVPAPVWAITALAQVTEWTMKVPLIAKAQARMLAEGVAEAAPPAPDLPAELRPSLPFSDEQIRVALPPKGGFGFADLRLARRSGTIVE
jgi:NADH dehydrogenase